MRWKGRDESNNVEDRRGRSPGFGGMPLRGPLGIVVVVAVLVAGAYGIDLTQLLSGFDPEITSSQPYEPSPEEQEMAHFTSVILKTTEDAWTEVFQDQGSNYAPPKLVMYTGATETTCGYGQSAMGPFYCPSDQTVYIDLSFYRDMKNSLGGGGDFAQGYVIAHEVGHHVQHLLGTEEKVHQMQSRASQKEVNQLSVALELQADCYAGVWGHAMENQGITESGDLEEALRTAEAIGDDRLQQRSTGRVVPDSFTHGTSKQRYDWFMRGYESGDLQMCDTFRALE